MEVKQNTARNVMVFMTDSADHVTGKTGLTLTITASKDGGAFASISPTVTERGNGWYNIALTASDTDTLGDLCLHVTGTGADPADLKLHVVANLEADTYSRLGTPAGASVSADIAAVKSQTAAIEADTQDLQTQIGTAGAGLTNLGDARLAELDAANMPADIDELLARLTLARAGYLDNLNVGGLVASQADIQGITQAQRVRIIVPPMMERPDSGSITYRIWIYSYNEQHLAEDLDSNPTVSAENNAGTDRSANLGAVAKEAGTTGVYYVDYTVASTHAIEGVVIKVDATEGGTTTRYSQAWLVVDTTAVDFTSSDRANLDALVARCTETRLAELDAANMPADIDTLLARITGQAALEATLTAMKGTGWSSETLKAIYDKLFDAATQTVDVGKINGSATAAARLALSAGTIVSGAAVAGALSTTEMTTDLTETTNNHYNGRIIIWTSGALKDQGTNITAYDGASKKLTFSAVTEPPAAGDTFIIV